MDLAYQAKGAASAERARERAKYTGMSPNAFPLWTVKEIETVRRLYPNFSAMRHALPRRTLNAIYLQAQRQGIGRKFHTWTASEVARLRRIYPTGTKSELAKAFPSLSWSQIKGGAVRRNIRRIRWDRPPPKPSGFPILDQVIRRAREYRYTMRELDIIAKTGNYFGGSVWTTQGLNRKAVYRAIEALDGEVAIVWR